MSITNLSVFIPEAEIDPVMASEKEFQAADKAHIDAADPHLQYPTQERADARYIRRLSQFNFLVPAPSYAANQWHEVGDAFVFGELGTIASWNVALYWQLDSSTFTNYGGAGNLGAIYWQADLLANEGVTIPIEAHNEVDFLCQIRFGRGNGLRKLNIKPNRNINIAAPGFFRASGIRIQ